MSENGSDNGKLKNLPSSPDTKEAEVGTERDSQLSMTESDRDNIPKPLPGMLGDPDKPTLGNMINQLFRTGRSSGDSYDDEYEGDVRAPSYLGLKSALREMEDEEARMRDNPLSDEEMVESRQRMIDELRAQRDAKWKLEEEQAIAEEEAARLASEGEAGADVESDTEDELRPQPSRAKGEERMDSTASVDNNFTQLDSPRTSARMALEGKRKSTPVEVPSDFMAKLHQLRVESEEQTVRSPLPDSKTRDSTFLNDLFDEVAGSYKDLSDHNEFQYGSEGGASDGFDRDELTPRALSGFNQPVRDPYGSSSSDEAAGDDDSNYGGLGDTRAQHPAVLFTGAPEDESGYDDLYSSPDYQSYPPQGRATPSPSQSAGPHISRTVDGIVPLSSRRIAEALQQPNPVIPRLLPDAEMDILLVPGYLESPRKAPTPPSRASSVASSAPSSSKGDGTEWDHKHGPDPRPNSLPREFRLNGKSGLPSSPGPKRKDRGLVISQETMEIPPYRPKGDSVGPRISRGPHIPSTAFQKTPQKSALARREHKGTSKSVQAPRVTRFKNQDDEEVETDVEPEFKPPEVRMADYHRLDEMAELEYLQSIEFDDTLRINNTVAALNDVVYTPAMNPRPINVLSRRGSDSNLEELNKFRRRHRDFGEAIDYWGNDIYRGLWDPKLGVTNIFALVYDLARSSANVNKRYEKAQKAENVMIRFRGAYNRLWEGKEEIMNDLFQKRREIEALKYKLQDEEIQKEQQKVEKEEYKVTVEERNKRINSLILEKKAAEEMQRLYSAQEDGRLNMDLHKKISELQLEKEALENDGRPGDLRERLDKAHRDHATLEEHLSRSEISSQTALVKNRQLQGQLEREKEKNADMKDRLERMQRDAKYRHEANKNPNSVQDEKNLIQQLTDECERLSNDNQKLQTTLSKSQRQVDQVTNAKLQVDMRFEGMIQELEEASQKFLDYESEIQGMDHKIRKLEYDTRLAASETSKNQTARIELEETLSERDRQVDEYMKNFDKSDEENSALRKQKVKDDETIRGLELEVANALEQLLQLEEADDSEKKLDTQYHDKLSQFGMVNRKVSELTKEQEKLEGRLQAGLQSLPGLLEALMKMPDYEVTLSGISDRLEDLLLAPQDVSLPPELVDIVRRFPSLEDRFKEQKNQLSQLAANVNSWLQIPVADVLKSLGHKIDALSGGITKATLNEDTIQRLQNTLGGDQDAKHDHLIQKLDLITANLEQCRNEQRQGLVEKIATLRQRIKDLEVEKIKALAVDDMQKIADQALKASQRDEIVRLQAQIEGLQKNLAALQADYTRAVAANQSAKDMLAKSESELKDDVRKRKYDMRTLGEERDSVANKLRKTEAKLSFTIDERDALTKQLKTEKKMALQSATGRLATLTAEKEQLKESNDQSRKDIHKLKKRLSDLEQDHEKLKQDYEKLKQDKEKLEQRLEKYAYRKSEPRDHREERVREYRHTVEERVGASSTAAVPLVPSPSTTAPTFTSGIPARKPVGGPQLFVEPPGDGGEALERPEQAISSSSSMPILPSSSGETQIPETPQTAIPVDRMAPPEPESRERLRVERPLDDRSRSSRDLNRDGRPRIHRSERSQDHEGSEVGSRAGSERRTSDRRQPSSVRERPAGFFDKLIQNAARKAVGVSTQTAATPSSSRRHRREHGSSEHASKGTTRDSFGHESRESSRHETRGHARDPSAGNDTSRATGISRRTTRAAEAPVNAWTRRK